MKSPRHSLRSLARAAARLTLLALLLAAPALSRAAQTDGAAAAGKPQSLTSPDQVPEGLAKSDWSNIRAAYEAGRHSFQPTATGWQARNPGQQWTTQFDKRGFLATPKDGGWTWGLELQSYGFPGAERAIHGVPAVKADGQRLTYQWDAAVQEWFVNDKRGLEHGFTVKERPAAPLNSQLPTLNSGPATLNFLLATRGSLTPAISDDAKGVLFRDAAGATVLNYTGLKVWDADGKVLSSRFELVEAPLSPVGPTCGRPSFSNQTDEAARSAALPGSVAELVPTGGPLVLSTLNSQPTVRLLVDERGARYPLTIDPIAQQAYVKVTGTGHGGLSDSFGASVAVSGDTVVVGATGEDSSTTGVNSTPNEGAFDSGAAYVFVRSGTTWTQQAYLKAHQVTSLDSFGVSVAVSGDTVVVGANAEDSSATGVNGTPDEGANGSGAAYVFVRSGTTWTQQAYLKASQVTGVDSFGSSVAVSGDTVVVGAFGEDSITTGVNSTPDELAANSGAAYVFVRSGTTWTQEAYLKAHQVTANDSFGRSVAVAGDTVVVGASDEDSSTTGVNSTPNELASGSGAAYVFVRSGTTWTQEAYLKAHQVTAGDFFGRSVAVSGDTVVVGANQEDSSTTGVDSTPNESANGAGAAYVFVRSGTTWTQEAYLKAHQVTALDSFGTSVAVSGDTVVVGANQEDSSTTGVNSTPDELAITAGAAYVFVRSGTTWTQQAYLKAHQVTGSDQFGNSVAISGDTVVVGATGEDSSTTVVNGTPDEGAAGSGAAYVFVRSGTAWTQQAYLKPADTGSGAVSDGFGIAVAVSGDTVVVGATAEKSSSTGVNSTPDESALDAGAAYVFVRSGTTWTQQAYLKAHQVSGGDAFGISVAVSGDTVVVGASGEDSSTTGVGSTPDESASGSGAAYVFVRSGTTWTQQAYLKAHQVTANDGFGGSVAVSGDTVVVGASGEDSSATGVNGTPDEGASASGAAYVFARSGTTWTQQAYLKASNAGANDGFGTSVAVSGDTAVAGATGEDSSTTGVNSTQDELASNAGAAYVFVRSGTTWTQQAYLKAHQVSAADSFGLSVAVAGDTVVVGAHLEDSSMTGVNSTPDEGAASSGAAYVFVRSGTTWTQQAYLKAHQVTGNDQFGRSVAVSGDTVVVGAISEDSSTTGVNSTQDELASNAGAAYVFVRSGTTWTQQAYLKAHQVTPSDAFGTSVAVSGDTVVVGAISEDSSSRGVNSTPDEAASASGAAYIFTGLGSTTPAPTVASITPTSGTTAGGTSVTLTGTGFTGATGVTLGGVAATSVTVVSDTSITCTTPAGTAGTASVIVTTPNGANAANTLFTYVAPTPAPTVTAIAPTSGTTAGGTSVTLTGTDFTGATGVTIGGVAATSVVVVNATTITCTTPAGTAGTASVVVTTPNGANAANTLFTYVAPTPAPTVTAIAPTSGTTAGGTSVTITGTGFTGATGVTLGGVAATGITVVSDTSITCTTPAGTAGTASVVVTTPNGANAANTLFTYVAPTPAPTVTAIAPTSGTTAGGTSVTITGTGFTGATGVTIGGVAATGITVVNATTITCTTPAGTAGTASVIVTTPNGANAANTLFTYAVPAPSGVTITFTEVGADVVATGSGTVNLTALTLAGTATFGGAVKASTGIAGVGPLANLNAFSGISGPAGIGSGGAVTVATAHTGDAFCVFGSAQTIYIPMGYVSGTALAGTATYAGKSFASLGLTPGTYVWTWGSGPTASSFTVIITAPVPAVTAISPTSGSTAGGTSVTLTGTGFTGATGVTIGGVAATGITVVNDTTITCTTPAGTAGTASVVVTTPGGANAANTLFTYSVANTAPVAVSDSYTVSQGDVLTATAAGVLANDTDIEGDALTATKLTDGAQGPVVLNANGGFTYTPSTNFFGTDTFTYRASDASSNSNPATVSILVYARPTNAVPGAQTMFANATLRFSATNTPLANAILTGDPDSTVLTVSLMVTNGTVTVSNLTGLVFANDKTNGTNVVLTGLIANVNAALESLAYKPKLDYFGDETLAIVTTDEGGRTNRGNGTVPILIEIPTLGGVPKVSLDSLNDPMTGLMITNVTAVALDTNLVQGISFDSVSNVVNVLPVGGQDGSTNRSTITVSVMFNDGTTRLITVPVIIYQPLLAAATNAGAAYNSTFGTPLFNFQNSLYEQKVRVQNNTPFDFTALRITATNLPATVTLQNATLTNGGLPYIDYNLTVLAGSNVTLKLEYFSSDLAPFTPGLKLELLNTTRTNTAPPGAVMTSVAPKTGYSPDGTTKNYLYFPSTVGQRYYVQYFDTVTVPQVWKTSGVVITGTGLEIHWMDDGPPSTETPPGPLRFYRVVTDR